MSKNYVLIKYEDNWADEFDIESLWFTTKENLNNLIKTVKDSSNYKDNTELVVYFGTNASIIIFPQNFISSLNILNIDTPVYNQLNHFLGEEFGIVSILHIFERILEDGDNW